jgi:hypothetical protein
MTMGRAERLKMQQVLKERFVESNKPTMANTAVFYDQQDNILYAGIITEWPMIISTDIEWGKVMELDASKEPFAGKTVKFFSPFTGN